MNLWNRIRDALRGAPPPAPAPPTMRNKPGGLARVRITDDGTGTCDMNGCYVTTVRLDERSLWVIDPPLQFTARVYMLTSTNAVVAPGGRPTVQSMHDDLLVPIGNPAHDEQDESAAWLPPVPTSTKVPKGIPV